MLKKYFDNYDSQQDQDYNPTKKQQAIYKQQHQKKKKLGIRNNSINDLWEQLQQQHKKQLKKIKVNEELQQNHEKNGQKSLQMAKKILNNENIKPDKRIIFAGKEYIMNEETGQLQIAQKIKPQMIDMVQGESKEQQGQLQHRKTKIGYHYLNHIMRAIYNRSRKINSIGKSKLDWRGFVKQEGIEHKLNYHRKGGVIKDMQFLKNAN